MSTAAWNGLHIFSLNSINTAVSFSHRVCSMSHSLCIEWIRYNAGGTAALQQPRDPQTSNPSISLNQPGKAEPSTDPIAQKFTRALIHVLSQGLRGKKDSRGMTNYETKEHGAYVWDQPTHIKHTYLHLCMKQTLSIWQYHWTCTKKVQKVYN